MRDLALIMGTASILIGLFLLLAPDSLEKIGQKTNRFYNLDSVVFKNRLIFGALLILAAFFLVYVTYFA